MKLITTIIAILTTSSVMAQGFKDNTLDINYNASYRETFNLRASTRISENNRWNLAGFNAGAGWRMMPGLNMTYELSRGHECNANLISKYGFGYQFSKTNLNLNMSVYSVNGTTREDGIHGRIDLSVKFK